VQTPLAYKFHSIFDCWSLIRAGHAQKIKFRLTRLISIDINNEVTSAQIKGLRKRLGLTQQQLADMIAATQVTVTRWETGSNEPKGAYLKALQELANKTKAKPKRRR
jgi:DNA-binding transcriptional regulator YiaG